MALVEQLCARLRVPNHLRELAVMTARYHTHVHRAFELRADTVLKTLESCDALRRPERFADFLLACEADTRGRTGLENAALPAARVFRGGARRRGRRRARRRKSAAACRASRSARNCASGASRPSRR